MLKEFKDFVMRGIVLDLAVALILGLAFSKIVTSLVNDIPPIGILLGHVDFANLFINLSGKPVQSVVEAKRTSAACRSWQPEREKNLAPALSGTD